MTAPVPPPADAGSDRSPRRRLFLIHGLSGGGSEKVAVELTRHWAATGHPTALVTLASASADRFTVGEGVERIGLDVVGTSGNPLSAIFANWRRIRRIREAVASFAPDVVVSFNDRTNVLAAFALKTRPYPLIVSERADPLSRPREPIWAALRRWTYPTVDALVVPSEGMRPWAESVARSAPVRVVPNACWSARESDAEVPSDAEREPIVLGMGRFDRQKGFDLLIDAFAQVAPRRPEWKLRIVGGGPEEGALTEQIEKAGLSARVELLPWTKDPAAHYRAARIFVLPSRTEGFPNALVEAMAEGLPAIAFDVRSGPADVVRSGSNGLLVEPNDAFALAAALHQMMGDADFRVACARRALDIRRDFSPAEIFARWEETLNSALRSRDRADR